MPKILIATAALVFSSIVAEASSNTNTKNNPDYTIRKDSTSTSYLSIDTNKRVVVFPNPFNIVIFSEEKR